MRHIFPEALRKQSIILDCIDDYSTRHGRKPTMVAIAENTGIHLSTVKYHLRAMRLNQGREAMQTRVFLFYFHYWQDVGCSPTYTEAAKALNTSDVNISHHVLKLKKQGLVRFDYQKTVRQVRVPAYEHWIERKINRGL